MEQLHKDFVFAGRYLLLEKIGIGGFSEVWKAKDQMADDTVVAIKVFVPERGMDDTGLKLFRREYSLVLNINHSKLLTARHFDVWEGSPYLVIPFCKKGSLYAKLIENGNFSELEIAVLLIDICSALANLHENGILHQDIKPENILINDKENYLLTDFGISGRLRSTLRKSTVTQKAMTMAYAAPELFGSQMSNTEKSDIFSIGVLICELATGDVPWMGNGGLVLRPDSELPILPEEFSRELNALMQQCMSYHPASRPTASDLEDIANNYIKTGSWQAVKTSESRPVEKPEPKRKSRETASMPFTPAFTPTSTQSSSQSSIPNLPSIQAAGKKRPWLVWLIIAGALLVISGLVAVIIMKSGPTAEEKAAKEKMQQDSIAKSDSIAKATAEIEAIVKAREDPNFRFYNFK